MINGKIGRKIIENLYNHNFAEVLKGGADVFYFMPGMRYANALFMPFFGDSSLGYFLITAFIPFIIYKILRKLINRNWSILLLWCFIIIPIFESFGFFQFYYSKLAVLGFGGSLGYFCLFLGVLVKRSAFALGFLILWQVFEGIFRGILRWKFFDGETTDSIMNLFPLQSMFNLIKEPFSRLGAVQSVANQMGEKLALNYHVHWYEVIIVLFWTAIFIYGSYKILKRRDL